MLTAAEARQCAQFAREYPAGSGYAFFQDSDIDCASDAADAIRDDPELIRFG